MANWGGKGEAMDHRQAVIGWWLWVAICLFGLAICAPLAAVAGEDCHRALLESFDRSVDASACGFLRLEDGRFAGIASDSGIFFRSNDGEGTLYTRIDIAGRSISVMRDAQTPWTHTIEGRQTFPDPKSYYYPLGLDPSGLGLFCPDPKNFSPSGEAPCD